MCLFVAPTDDGRGYLARHLHHRISNAQAEGLKVGGDYEPFCADSIVDSSEECVSATNAVTPIGDQVCRKLKSITHNEFWRRPTLQRLTPSSRPPGPNGR
jgi:hypothetical protein